MFFMHSQRTADTLTERFLWSGWYSEEHSSVLIVQNRAENLKGGERVEILMNAALKLQKLLKNFSARLLALTFHRLPSALQKCKKVDEWGVASETW